MLSDGTTPVDFPIMCQLYNSVLNGYIYTIISPTELESASPKRQAQNTSNGAEELKSQRNTEEHWRKYLCREIGRRNIVR